MFAEIMAGKLDRKQGMLLIALLAVAVLPGIGALLQSGHLPPEFCVFPPSRSGAPKPGFSASYLAFCVLIAAPFVAFLGFPRVLGFRERGSRQRAKGSRLPWWFWAGLLVNVSSWALHWSGATVLARYSFVPLWWGFIVTIDGVVYARTGGKSLLATEGPRMLALAVVSMPAWAYFEFMNYYALEFWVYPNNRLFSPGAQAAWYFLSFSVVWPAVFEWFTLLHSSDALWNRWSNGPVLSLPPGVARWLLVSGLLALVLFGAYPFQSLPLLWLAPMVVLSAAPALLGLWTPFDSIARGNWSRVALIGLASLINGFFWEFWNFGSTLVHPHGAANPNYWYYEIPYVDGMHFFSEMPLLGYVGYVPFGVLVWVLWLVAARQLGQSADFDLTPIVLDGRASSSDAAPRISTLGVGKSSGHNGGASGIR